MAHWKSRSRKWVRQRMAASLVPEQQVAGCMFRPRKNTSTVAVTMKAEGRAGFRGLQICGSVWACPVCAPRIAEVRRGELNDLLAWIRAQPGLVPLMLTLTARHGIRDRLADLLGNLKLAKRILRQSKAWRALKEFLRGTVTATEMTHGLTFGWHVHFHEILLVRAGTEAEALALVEKVRAAWLHALGKVGMSGTGVAFQAQGAAEAGNYITKWGVAEELTLANSKTSKTSTNRTPDQLLADATNGDKRAGRLWAEFARAAHGRRQLVWSPGLKALAGIGEITDAEAAEAEPAEPLVATHIPTPIWRLVRHRIRAEILEAAEEGFASGGLAGADCAVWALIYRILAPPGLKMTS